MGGSWGWGVDRVHLVWMDVKLRRTELRDVIWYGCMCTGDGGRGRGLKGSFGMVVCMGGWTGGIEGGHLVLVYVWDS